MLANVNSPLQHGDEIVVSPRSISAASGAIPEWLTASEIADGLQVSTETVGDWISTGKLPATNLGTPEHPRWRVYRADLNEYLRSLQPGYKPAPPRDAPGEKLSYSVPEVARMLRKGQDTIRDWINTGKLPAKDVGSAKRRRFQILRTDLQEFLRGRTVAPPPKRSSKRLSQNLVKFY